MTSAEQQPAESARRDIGIVIGGGIALSMIILAITFGISWIRPDSAGGGGATEANITLSEFAIEGTLTVPAGNVVLNVTNSGSQVHTVRLVETDKTSANIQAGGSAKLDLGNLEPGDYTLDCTIPGHKDSGMVAKFTVTAADAAPVAAGDASGAEASSGSHSHEQLANGEGTEEEYAKLSADMDASVNAFVKGEAAVDGKGSQPLAPTQLADGTKVFDLEAKIIDWQVDKNKTVKAWSYNGQVPGPLIAANVGDKIQIRLKNSLPMATDMHLHGVDLQSNEFDGVAPLTQPAIEPGETFTYEFTATATAVAMYHAHHHGHFQVINGLFAPLVIGNPADWIPRGETISGRTIPTNVQPKQQIEMVLNDAGNIGLTLNGKSFPSTDAYKFKKDDWFIVNYYNEGFLSHPMHQHQLWQLVIAKDGIPLEQPYWMDTLNVAPGERYTVAVWANAPGAWVWHCHILNHVESDAGLFGMATAVIVE